MASDNKSLGKFILDGIPPAPRGMPQVEVTFDVDANGILNVTAKEKTSGKTQSIRIEAGSGLTDADIKRMQDDAEKYAEEDKKKREAVEIKNTAEMIMYSAEKSLKDAEGKIDEALKTEVQAKIDALKAVKDGGDADAIKKATEELSSEMSKIGEAMAKSQQAEQGSQAQSNTDGSQAGGEEPNVRDAETGESK